MPGIKVVYPAFPSDARSLIYASVMDPNPVVFLENKYLYRHVKELVPARFEPLPLGSARVCRSGRDAVVITYGAMVHECMKASAYLHYPATATLGLLHTAIDEVCADV